MGLVFGLFYDVVLRVLNSFALLLLGKRELTRDFTAFSCSTQLNMKFILLIYVKLPTIVGILKFISMINSAPDNFDYHQFGYWSK